MRGSCAAGLEAEAGSSADPVAPQAPGGSLAGSAEQQGARTAEACQEQVCAGVLDEPGAGNCLGYLEGLYCGGHLFRCAVQLWLSSHSLSDQKQCCTHALSR